MSNKQKIKRIYHTWDKWECYPCGFYENKHKTMNDDECLQEYKNFLKDIPRFENALKNVIKDWKNSCEHYLTNEKMNRIAWLGQASLCISTNIPSKYRSGYFLLSKEERQKADELALKYLNIWLRNNGYNETDLIGAGINSHADIY